MESGVSPKVPESRIRAGENETSGDSRLSGEDGEVQGRLAVVVEDVQQAWVRRHPYQTESRLQEALDYRDVQLSGKSKYKTVIDATQFI